MRKVLITAAALLLCAAPVRAQQALATTVDPAPAAQADEQQAPRTASLYPTTDEVRRQVSTVEARRNATSPMGSRDWWYLVAAIAVGVIIAAILL